jgi:GMP synthase PP-ATPase subunit
MHPSSVQAKRLLAAQLTCVFVDHGALAGVTEVKRTTIGRLFIDVFDAVAKKLGGAEFRAQGVG